MPTLQYFHKSYIENKMLLMSKKKKNSVSNRPKLETRNNLSEFAVEDKKCCVHKISNEWIKTNLTSKHMQASK